MKNNSNNKATEKNNPQKLELYSKDYFENYPKMVKNNQDILQPNNNLVAAKTRQATFFAEIIAKNEEISKLNSKLAKVNARLDEIMAQNESKDKEINEVNARSANLIARRELQVLKIRELNRELQYEIEVRQKTEQKLKRSNDAKDRFLSIIAHDLKNPLISFVDFSTILKEHFESFSKEEIIEMIDDLHTSAQNMQILLENLLEWAKSQTNQLEVNPETYRLKPVFNETLSVCIQHANSKNIQIETKISDDISVWADKNLLSTVIRNLLSNAIKFSESNSKISAYAIPAGNKILVSIKDNGIGISENKMEKLFQVDSKVTSLGTAKERGTGLGLILCKEFVEQNGGVLSVESKSGEGSIFSFTVPAAKMN
ncbi:MAG: hypothetical protein JXR31_14985 [Prolixibacteraceae bacterium]|nr:hypothetical protein [Prolixibacteraceae bacterium]MBN2775559.1 hypothetical protein [Prolixibacteraceae bacterium]